MDIKTLSVTELKALAYEQIVLVERTKQNIAVIEQELNNRVQQVPEKPIDND